MEEDLDFSDFTHDEYCKYASFAHYASPYYDPQKAHEYYMRTRELKGRDSSSTPSLNEKGVKAAAYVSSRIAEERQHKINDEENNALKSIQTGRNQMNEEVKQFAESTKASIEGLYSRMEKAMNNPRMLDNIRKQIKMLRAKNKQMRSKLEAAYAKSSNKTRTDLSKNTEKINSDYQSKLDSELNKIRKDKSMT